MKIKDTRHWMNSCPEWCTEKHLGGGLFRGAHMSVETFPPPPRPPALEPKNLPTWTREKFLLSGTTYLACVSSEIGRVLLVIDPDETIEDFEKRIRRATSRMFQMFQGNNVQDHDFEDVIDYVQGY